MNQQKQESHSRHREQDGSTPLFSVFTPTYNRAQYLERLFRSLLKQDASLLEWIIVDDGSTDRTKDVVSSFAAPFKIIYSKQSNGGKHRAINRGVQLASGQFFFIVDSDDYLCDHALEIAQRYALSIGKDAGLGGVCGLKCFPNGAINGTTFEGDFLDITTLERPKYGISGDKAEIFITSLFRQYPFPEFEGETFCTERVVYDRIAHDGYKLRFFNCPLVCVEYLADGLTAHYNNLLLSNPWGYGCFLAQCREFGAVSKKSSNAQYVVFYLEQRKKHSFSKIAHMLHQSFLSLGFLFATMVIVRTVRRITKPLRSSA